MNVPADFEWVKARAECSPAKVFQQLKREVEADVKAINALRPAEAGYGFGNTSTEQSITVFIQGKHTGSVVFEQTQNGVSVRSGNDRTILVATVTLNDDGECRLRIRDREYQTWQLRKMSLQSLFFDHSSEVPL